MRLSPFCYNTHMTPLLIPILILTGSSDLPYHDWRLTTPFVRQMLERDGKFKVDVNEDPRTLDAKTLKKYKAVVLNYNGPRWGANAEKALEGFLRKGGGMVAFHGVSYGYFLGMELSPKKRWVRAAAPDAAWKAYIDMIGTDWEPANVGHAVRGQFKVKIADPKHRITSGMEPEFMTDDELYHKMAHRPGIHILTTAWSDPAKKGTGKDEPISWAVAFGKGRVYHTTLGHDVKAMSAPEFITLFTRACEWAAGRK